MFQCPACGHRTRGARCPTHGAPAALSAAAVAPEPPIIPGYRIDGVLGSGGYGTVFSAEGAAGRVAIKTAHAGRSAAAARLRREAAALQAVGAPHVPAFHAEGDLADGTFYIVMELVTWPTLAHLLADRPPFSPDEMRPIADGILVALGAAHALGMVHRDIKPENLFVDPRSGTARLLDFGLVRSAAATVGDTLTLAGAVVGSAIYMSPEQAAGRAEIDERTDIYAAGVLLYEMLAGRPPFLGSAADVVAAHIARRPPRLSTLAPVPGALDALVHRCLAKRREDRPASCAELRTALAAATLDAPASPPSLTGVSLSPAPGVAREKRVVGAIFFRTEGANAPTVQARVAAHGGSLARADGRFVAVFDQDAGDNPARLAHKVACEVCDRGVAARVIVDTVPVTVLVRADGSRRYASSRFDRDDVFPAAGDPEGVMCTAGCADLFADLAAPPTARGLHPLRHEPAPAAVADIVGRDGEIETVCQAVRLAAGGQPAIVTLSGEAGAGKSQLLGAAIATLRVQLPHLEFLELRARESGSASASTLAELLQLALGLPREPPADRGRAALAERIGIVLAGEVWPGVAVALGWAAAADDDVRAVAAAPGVLRAAAARAIGAGLRQRALERPVLVALDDAHLADLAGLDGLEQATRREEEARVAVLVAARPALLEGRPGWGESAATQRRIVVGPLEDAAAGQLLRRLLAPAEGVPADVIERLVARTRGLPLLMTELARGLKRDGFIRRQDKGDAWYLAMEALDSLPDAPLVDWLAGRELAQLPADLARHARLCALLGAETTRAELAGVLLELDRAGQGGDLGLDPDVATARLVEAGLFAEPVGQRIAYRSGVVREAVERQAPPALATPVHEAAYRFHTGPDGQLAARAHHAARCGRPRESFASWLELAREAEARHAYLDAERHYGAAIEQRGHGEPVAELGAAWRGRGLMRNRLARYDQALHDLAQAREQAAARGDLPAEIAIILDEATVLDWIEEFHRSREKATQAEEAAGRLAGGAGALLEARLTLARARSHFRFNENEAAAPLFLDAARRAETLGEEAYETLVVALLLGGFVLTIVGRLDEAEAAFNRVIPLLAARGDKLHLTGALANRFPLWAARRQPGPILADLQLLLEMGRELGSARHEYGVLGFAALCLHWIGESRDAESYARRAIEVEDRYLGAAAHLEGRVLLARILALRGDLDAAAGVLADIRGRHDAALARGQRDAALLPAEEVLVAEVDLLTRGGSPDEWRALASRAREVLSGADLDEVVRSSGSAISAAR